MMVTLSAEVVGGADLQEGLLVQDVEAHQRGPADAVDADRIAGDSRVEPADAAWAAGDGAELVAAFADLVPGLVEELRGEGAIADARRVRLEDSDCQVDLG